MTASQHSAQQKTISDRERQLTDRLTVILTRPPLKRRPPRTAQTQDSPKVILPEDFKTDFESGFEENDDLNDLKAGDICLPAQNSITPFNSDELRELEDNSPPERENNLSETDQPETVAGQPDFSNTTIIKKTRHARFQKGVRQAGSWLITLIATIFITGCVSIMLFGLPRTLNPTTWITAQASNPVANDPIMTASPRAPDK